MGKVLTFPGGRTRSTGAMSDAERSHATAAQHHIQIAVEHLHHGCSGQRVAEYNRWLRELATINDDIAQAIADNWKEPF